MGNVNVHAEIGKDVLQRLQRVRSGEEYRYMMLGNFLTDLSQFRDPYSFQTAKWTARNQVRHMFPVPIISQIPVAVVNSWLNELLGVPHGPDSALSKFFIRLARAMTFWINKAHSENPLFPMEELSRILNEKSNILTQYYPHEHLDWPPYSEGPDAQSNPLYQLRRGALVGWLEEQIQYLSEELTKLELKWMQAASRTLYSQERHDVLIRLGHLLHTIEDFFFHSNFIETDWRLNKGDSLPATPSGGAFSEARLRRKAHRRLRYPIFLRRPEFKAVANEFVPSRTRSLDCLDTVITGGFGATDMMFTIEMALEGLERVASSSRNYDPRAVQALVPQLPPDLFSLLNNLGRLAEVLAGLRDSNLVLVQLTFDEVARRRLTGTAGVGALERALNTHRSQISRDSKTRGVSVYEREIDNARRAGKIPDEVANELTRAFEVDWELERKHHPKLHGVGGFLIRLLKDAQEEVDRSDTVSRQLDGAPGASQDASYNGASDENIGSHSLLSKDGKSKQPFYNEAKALATHASSSVAVILAKRINEDQDVRNGLDWDSILRHFLRYPKRDRVSWENVVLDAIQRGEPLPELEEVQDRPQFRKLELESKSEASKLYQRRSGTKRVDLENRYKDLESYADNPRRPREVVPTADDPT